MKLSIKDFFSKFLQDTADLVTFTEEILNGKLHFLCSDVCEESSYPIWCLFKHSKADVAGSFPEPIFLGFLRIFCFRTHVMISLLFSSFTSGRISSSSQSPCG